MTKTILAAVFLLILSVTATQAQDSCDSKVSLIVPQCNMFPNPDLKTGDVLFGLFSTSIGHLLLPAKITVTSGVDERCDKFTKIGVDHPEKPVFMIKGLPDLKTGSIKTSFSGSKFLYPGELVMLSMRDQEKGRLERKPLMIRAVGNAVEHGKNIFVTNYRVELQDGDRDQTLDFYKNSAPITSSRGRRFGVLDLTDHMVKYDLTTQMELPTLIWAGDLDVDDKPDLFMWWPCPGRNAGIYSLYLSSMASDGDLVAKIPVGVRTYFVEP